MTPMMSRRTFFALGVAAGGLVAAGAALVANGYRYWIEASLREALPGYAFEPNGLTRFVDDYRAAHGEPMKFRLLGVVERVVEIEPLLPAGKAHRVEDEERQVVTEFLLGSDFFQHYPLAVKEIAYNGRTIACRSPFARFDDA
jgi:hypothetical protein